MQKILFKYLKFWVGVYLRRTKPEIVAITGSVGKTSAKEAIFEVLKVKFGGQVRKSEGNLNNESGVPVAILDFKKAPSYEAKNPLGWIPIILSAPFKSFFLKKVEVLVLELAADKPGDMKYLTSFIKPKIAVLTAIGPAHLEAFKTIDRIVEEKTDLLRALTTGGWAIISLDSELLRKVYFDGPPRLDSQVETGRWQKKSYAVGYDAEVQAENIQTKIIDFKAETSFDIKIDSQKEKVILPTLGGFSNVSAALAGAAVGIIYQMSLSDIAKGLNQVQNEKHRMNVLRAKNNSTIIDDSYNANPQSMKVALDLMKLLPGGRKIAVLGQMRELGSISEEAHKEIGQIAQKVTDLVIEVGDNKYGADKNFTSTEETIEFLLKEVQPSDIILIKASRTIGLDKIADSLKQ